MQIRRGAIATVTAVLLTTGAAVPAYADSAGADAARTSGDIHTQGAGVFGTYGDKVHISSSAPRTASAHGWWRKFSGDGSKAKVTVWLQVRAKKGSRWHTVDKGVKNVKPAKKGSRKPSTTARKKCNNHKTRQWRSVIDVDIIGVNDSPEKAYTKTVKLRCGV